LLPGWPPGEAQRTRGNAASKGCGCRQGLGIATVDAILGALFGLAGFVVLRVPANFLAIAYTVLGLILAATGLALLRVVRVVIPVLVPSPKPTRTFVGSYLLGLPSWSVS